MESSGLLNGSVRVKEEHNDVPFIENDREMIDEKPDLKNFQLLPLSRENSTYDIGKYGADHESELDDKVKIVFECEYVNPNVGLSVIKKMDDYESRNILKTEAVNEVKQELISDGAEEELRLNFDSENVEENEKRRITKELKNEYNLEAHVGTAHNDTTHLCGVCGKQFANKNNLKKHIDSVHDGVTHACGICRKSFSQKSYLKIHIETIHNGITHKCDICQKAFASKNSLKRHVDTVHNAEHECDICGKTFSCKTLLKTHIEVVYNGVKYTCDTCGKTLIQKSNLQSHIHSAHDGVTYGCDICGKSFSLKGNLKAHINAVHNRIACIATFAEKFLAESLV